MLSYAIPQLGNVGRRLHGALGLCVIGCPVRHALRVRRRPEDETIHLTEAVAVAVRDRSSEGSAPILRPLRRQTEAHAGECESAVGLNRATECVGGLPIPAAPIRILSLEVRL